MRVLITGANGFIGRNLSWQLRNTQADATLFEYSHKAAPDDLNGPAGSCDCVVHLAGANRPTSPDDYIEGNPGFTAFLLNKLEQRQNACPVIFASSTQAESNSPYGRSKKACEELLLDYAKRTGAKVLIYRLPNVFGKWCRVSHNSAVVTFCHQIARGLPIRVDDRDTVLSLTYIDDVVGELIRAIKGEETRNGDFCSIPDVYTKTLGEIVELLYSFKACRETAGIPELGDGFQRKLYSTYLSYLPPDALAYPLRMNTDGRGSFTEVIRTVTKGQYSVSLTKPGIMRGNHWHQSKNEKFIVVYGQGKIRLFPVGGDSFFDYDVSGEKMEVVEIPPGYAHQLINTGLTDLVTLIWSNEPYDPKNPDTYNHKM